MVLSDDPEVDFHQNYLKKELFAQVQQDSLIFEFIQEGVLDGVWYWDLLEPENEWMSPKFWQTFGYDPRTKRHLASEWQDMIFEEDLKVAIRNFERHIADPTYPYDQVVRYKHKDGSTVWVRCRGLAIHDETGRAVRMVGAHTDVTPMMKKTQELVKEQLNTNELQALLLNSENALKIQKVVNESQKQCIEAMRQFNEETGFWLYHHAKKEALKFFEVTQRAQIPCNYFLLRMLNFDWAKNTFGAHEVENTLATANKVIKDLCPNFVLTMSDNCTILGMQIGYPSEDFSEVCRQIVIKLDANQWSIVEPTWLVTDCTKIPATTETDSLEAEFNRFFEGVYTELSQRLF